MSNTAAGGSNGIVAAGPTNKYDGATAAPGVDGCSDLNFGSIAPIDHDAPDYPAKTSAGWALGSVPD